jgi:hypothetical protein
LKKGEQDHIRGRMEAGRETDKKNAGHFFRSKEKLKRKIEKKKKRKKKRKKRFTFCASCYAAIAQCNRNRRLRFLENHDS